MSTPPQISHEFPKKFVLYGRLRAKKKTSPILQRGLTKLANHPLVGEARCVGLLGAIELVKNKKTKSPFELNNGVGALLAARAQANGLITRAMGDSLAFAPPLIIEKKQIIELLELVEISLDETLDILTERKI